MKILILGKNGNLGNEFAQLLTGSDHELLLWDKRDLDITKKDKVQEKIIAAKPDVVINCTGYTNVDKAEEDYITAMLINCHAVGYIAEACKNVGALLVHFSTGMVFPGNDPKGYNEDDEPDAVNAYGRSKLLGEIEVKKKIDQHYIIRTEWLYAKTKNPKAKKSFTDIILEMADKQEFLQGVIDEIGRPTWTKDLGKASIDLVFSKAPFGVYHISNSGEASRLEWAKEILAIKSISKDISSVSGASFPRPAKRPHYELLNNTKLTPLRSWQEALKEYLTTNI